MAYTSLRVARYRNHEPKPEHELEPKSETEEDAAFASWRQRWRWRWQGGEDAGLASSWQRWRGGEEDAGLASWRGETSSPLEPRAPALSPNEVVLVIRTSC